jgi:hypothetical protein
MVVVFGAGSKEIIRLEGEEIKKAALKKSIGNIRVVDIGGEPHLACGLFYKDNKAVELRRVDRWNYRGRVFSIDTISGPNAYNSGFACVDVVDEFLFASHPTNGLFSWDLSKSRPKVSQVLSSNFVSEVNGFREGVVFVYQDRKRASNALYAGEHVGLIDLSGDVEDPFFVQAGEPSNVFDGLAVDGEDLFVSQNDGLVGIVRDESVMDLSSPFFRGSSKGLRVMHHGDKRYVLVVQERGVVVKEVDALEGVNFFHRGMGGRPGAVVNDCLLVGDDVVVATETGIGFHEFGEKGSNEYRGYVWSIGSINSLTMLDE